MANRTTPRYVPWKIQVFIQFSKLNHEKGIQGVSNKHCRDSVHDPEFSSEIDQDAFDGEVDTHQNAQTYKGEC